MNNDSPKSFDTIRKSLDQSLAGQAAIPEADSLAPSQPVTPASDSTPVSPVPVGPSDMPNPADYPVSYVENQPTAVLPVQPEATVPVTPPAPLPVPGVSTGDPLFATAMPDNAGAVIPPQAPNEHTNPVKRDLMIVGIILMVLLLLAGGYGGYLFAVGEGFSIGGYQFGGKESPAAAITTSETPAETISATETAVPSTSPSASSTTTVNRTTNRTNSTPTPTTSTAVTTSTSTTTTSTTATPSEEPIITPPPPPS